MQFNVALYRIDTDGIQISGPGANVNNPGLVITKFGSTRTYGFEAELAARVASGVRVNLGVGHADPEFGKDAFDFFAAGACASFNAATSTFTPIIAHCAGRVQRLPAGSQFNSSTIARNALSLDGLSTPRTPHWTLNGGVDLEGSIRDDWTWNGNVTARHETKQFGFNNNISTYGPRTIVNLRAGIANATYSMSRYVNNLTDDRTPEIIAVNARLSDFQGDMDGYLPVGRQYGITVGGRF